MKKGFWNYTQPITYRVLLVHLLPVPDPPAHWQNAYAGQERQIIEIEHDGYNFWIDNQDGSGLKKIQAGGGPDSYSAHVKSFILKDELPEEKWQQYDICLNYINRKKVDAWIQKEHPEVWEKMQALNEAWNNSPVKKFLDEQRKEK